MNPTPPLSDKAILMKNAIEAVKHILDDKDLSDEVALRRAGITLAGGINFIHPYGGGNGRTGRLIQYLMEYGTERGFEAFEVEAYAIINGAPIFEGEHNNASDMRIGILQSELDRGSGEFQDERHAATKRVSVFLDAMTGVSPILTQEDNSQKIPAWINDGSEIKKTEIPVGTDIRDACSLLYEHFSTIPNRRPPKFSDGTRILQPNSTSSKLEALVRILTSEYV